MASTINAKNTSTGVVITPDSSGQLELQTADTTRMTIDVNGNVGVNTVGARIRGDFSNATISNRVALQSSTTNGATRVMVIPNGTSNVAAINCTNSSDPNNASFATMHVQESSDVRFQSTIAGTGTYLPMTFYTGGSERMRIDSSGNLLVNSTSTSYAYSGDSFRWANGIGVMCSRPTTNNTNQVVFFNPNGQVGFINTSGSATSYGTSSDYRLKENIAPMTGALDVVAQLKPVTYTWKVDGSDGQGFIAHELQEVVPDAVTGEKDAVDNEGNPVYQGIDTSFLVATLTAAIQELKAIIDTQAERIAVLENKIV